jgi:molybdate transport system permease protein
MGLPLLVRAVRQGFDAVDPGLEAAAATLGASPAWVFATVTLPLVLPGLLTGMLLAFARSLGEFGATITFVSNIPGETQTLPLAIYTFTQVPGGDAQAMRLCILSIVLSLAALMASECSCAAPRCAPPAAMLEFDVRCRVGASRSTPRSPPAAASPRSSAAPAPARPPSST